MDTVLAAPFKVTVAPLPTESGLIAPEMLHRGDTRVKVAVREVPLALAVRMAD